MDNYENEKILNEETPEINEPTEEEAIVTDELSDSDAENEPDYNGYIPGEVINAPENQPAKALAVTSLVLGILSFLCIGFGGITAIAATVLGIVAKCKGNTGAAATAGIVSGVVGIISQALIIITIITSFSFVTF